jgi:hypothetical protein
MKFSKGRCSMSNLQKAIILIGVVLILAMGLFPPWFHTKIEKGFPKEERASIYSPIFKPPLHPEVKKDVEVLHFLREKGKNNKFDDSDRSLYLLLTERLSNTCWGVCLDVSRLLIQWAMVIITVAGLVVIIKKKI